MAIILPQQDYLMMITLRYNNEVRSLKEFTVEDLTLDPKIKISAREFELAE